MTDYNVRVELDTRDHIDNELVDHLAAYHPATGRTPQGRVEVWITLPAVTLTEAVRLGLLLVGAVSRTTLVAVEAMTTAEFDRRLGQESMPALVSVTEAAEQLGVSRQAVQQRLDAGTLPGQKVGKTWVVQASAVEAALAAALHRTTPAERGLTDVSHGATDVSATL